MFMAFLEKETMESVKNHLSVLREDVEIRLFKSDGCEYCSGTFALLDEVANLSDKITLKTFDIAKDKSEAEKFNVDKTPAIAISKKDKDYGIRMFGIPTGYEFTSLLEAIKMVSTSNVDMSDDVIEEIKKIDKSVHLQVYVTPMCPHCPRAVVDAHRFALLNDNIKAEMVEASEFPELSNKYGVMGVPQIVINEKPVTPGALPIQMFLDEINKVIA